MPDWPAPRVVRAVAAGPASVRSRLTARPTAKPAHRSTMSLPAYRTFSLRLTLSAQVGGSKNGTSLKGTLCSAMQDRGSSHECYPAGAAQSEGAAGARVAKTRCHPGRDFSRSEASKEKSAIRDRGQAHGSGSRRSPRSTGMTTLEAPGCLPLDLGQCALDAMLGRSQTGQGQVPCWLPVPSTPG